jgi:hypothetical protein
MDDKFRKLQQQYFEATMDERERLWPDFIRAIRKSSPGLLETFETRFRNGDYLKDMFDQCVKRVLARSDLAPGRKTNALEEAAGFMAAFDELKQADPNVGALAYELATRALFTALRAGLNPDEVEELRQSIFINEGRKGGRKRAEVHKERPWWARAENLALEADGNLSNEKIAMYIRDNWEPKEKPASPLPKCPEHRTLTKFVSKLRADKKLPQRRGSLPN